MSDVALLANDSAAREGYGPTDRPIDGVGPELVSAAVRGDPGATERLLRLLRPVVFRYCARRLGGHDHRAAGPEDCAQDVLAAILVALPRYRYPAERFLSFVFGVAAHKIVDVYRSRTLDRSAPVADLGDGYGDHRRAAVLRDEIEMADHRLTISWLLRRLPRRHREVIALRVLLGYSAEETAVALGMPSAVAVRVTQHRALNALRQMLAGDTVRGLRAQNVG